MPTRSALRIAPAVGAVLATSVALGLSLALALPTTADALLTWAAVVRFVDLLWLPALATVLAVLGLFSSMTRRYGVTRAVAVALALLAVGVLAHPFLAGVRVAAVFALTSALVPRQSGSLAVAERAALVGVVLATLGIWAVHRVGSTPGARTTIALVATLVLLLALTALSVLVARIRGPPGSW